MRKEHDNKPKLYYSLLDDILTGKILPGQKLREVKIAQEYGISRTPVREAIRLLANDNLVIIIPNVGAQLRVFSLAEIDELFLLRYYLSEMNYNYLIEKMDDKIKQKLHEILKVLQAVDYDDIDSIISANWHFNRDLWVLADFKIINKYYYELTKVFSYLRNINNYYEESNRRAVAVQEHIAIINAILQQDSEQTRACLKQHIAGAKAHFLKIYNK